MNTERLLQLVARDCLAEDRPLGEALARVLPGAFVAARSAASAGRLEQALSGLGFDAALVRLGALWPRALRPAARRVDALPSPARLRVPLVQTAVALGFVAVVQSLVVAVLSSKVLPVLLKIRADHGLAVLSPVEETSWLLQAASGLLRVAVVALALWGALVWSGPAWWPGWGRHLARAREALLAAALVEAQAPGEVVRAWLAGSPSLARFDVAPVAEDLEALGASQAADAERAMQVGVARLRLVGFGALTVVALLATLAVYGSVAGLARLR